MLETHLTLGCRHRGDARGSARAAADVNSNSRGSMRLDHPRFELSEVRSERKTHPYIQEEGNAPHVLPAIAFTNEPGASLHAGCSSNAGADGGR